MEKYKKCMILLLFSDKKANKAENMAEIVFFLRGGGVKYNALYINKIMSILLKSPIIRFN